MDFEELLKLILIGAPTILISSTVHEYAHAWVAYKLGDFTAKSMGRLTLNPISHIDPIGGLMIILSQFRFGWSKPVPVNENNFANPVTATALVAVAGPISNIILATIAAIIFRIFFASNAIELILQDSIIISFFIWFTSINLSLAFFNLLPIPPLDGSRIVRAIMPDSWRYNWERLEVYAPLFILLLILPFSPFGNLILGGLQSILSAVFNWMLGI